MKIILFIATPFILLINSNILYSQSNQKQLLYSEIIESTNSKIELYKIQEANNVFIIQIIISVENPSPLGSVNYLGEGLVYLIVPETMHVYYDDIDIKFSRSATSDDYLSYEPPSSASNQIKKIGVFLTSMLPYVGQVIGATALLSEEINSFNFSSANNYIDRNKYDAVDINWLMKAFKYYQKLKIEIPLESTGDPEIGLYANWVTKATNETSGPIHSRDNKSYPGFIVNPMIDGNKPEGVFTDPRDDQTYNIVTIGNQIWFAENLNYETANSWFVENLNYETTNSWWGDNNSANGYVYSRLYTWEAATTACPYGWHLPTDEEWKTLEMYLGMSQSEADSIGYRGTDEGKKLKSTSGWFERFENGNGTDVVGFTALPGGFHSTHGNFNNLVGQGNWWTATADCSTYAWHHRLSYNSDKVYRNYHYKALGFSVRCIKD